MKRTGSIGSQELRALALGRGMRAREAREGEPARHPAAAGQPRGQPAWHPASANALAQSLQPTTEVEDETVEDQGAEEEEPVKEPVQEDEPVDGRIPGDIAAHINSQLAENMGHVEDMELHVDEHGRGRGVTSNGESVHPALRTSPPGTQPDDALLVRDSMRRELRGDMSETARNLVAGVDHDGFPVPTPEPVQAVQESEPEVAEAKQSALEEDRRAYAKRLLHGFLDRSEREGEAVSSEEMSKVWNWALAAAREDIQL